MRQPALILPLVAAACGASGARATPDAGPIDRVDPRAALCAGVDAANPPFAAIQAIFDANCIECHTTGADLDLSAGHPPADLVGQPAPAKESCGGMLVVPGDPGASYLYQKLSSATPCAGQQMPIAQEIFSNPLPDCLVALVRAWIAAGASAN